MAGTLSIDILTSNPFQFYANQAQDHTRKDTEIGIKKGTYRGDACSKLQDIIHA